MATLTVGQNKQFATIAAAVAAARDGDTVAVQAGTYLNDFATIRTTLNLVAVGGQVTVMATRPLPAGRGILTVAADATVTGFVFTGAAAADGNGAGVLYQGGNLVLKNSLIIGNQNGLLGNADPRGTIVVQASEISSNGKNDGFTHNLSVGAIRSLTIEDSYIHDAQGGAEVRSRARATTVVNSRILDNNAAAGAGIDLPNGGVVSIRNSTIEKGAAATVAAAVRNGGDTVYAGSSLSITGTTIIASRAGAIAVLNTAGTPASVSAGALFGFSGSGMSGPVATSGNTVAAVRPALAASSIVLPGLALPAESGRAGAVVANGTVLTVGAPGGYGTLEAALAVARDGDTIRVAAGTYDSPALTIRHKVIIEGTGGIARFLPTAAPSNGMAQFVTVTDVTFRNIEIAGVATPGGVAAAIRDQAGRLTVVNSYIHGNQAGIVADAGLASSVGIYDSEIANNGTPDGRGGNVDVAEIGTLTLRNGYVHDALAGAEVRSRADNTTVADTRISQAAGNGAANLLLPDGGLVSVTGSVLQKSATAQATALVHVGGGEVHGGTSVTLAGNTFITEQAAPTRFVVAEAGTSGVTVSGSVFVGGAAASVQVENGVNNGASVQSGLLVGGGAPWGVSGAPAAAALTAAAPAPLPPGRGIMVLRLSGDAYQGSAKFTLSIDGQQVGGTLAAVASHAAGETQTFTIAGEFAEGPHSVAVTFVNDLQGADPQGSPGQDRNLYVDGLTFNGEDMNQTATLNANGTALLSTGPISRLTPVTVNLSQDAWNGDAQAFIAIDGKVLGGLQMITASHAAGESQAMRFLPSLAPGAHTAAITFLNAGGSRALYVDSIDVAGAHYGSAAASVTRGAPGSINGATSTFAFTVAPPPAANNDLFLTAGAPYPMLIAA